MASNFLDVSLRLSLNRAGLNDARNGLQQVSRQIQQLRNAVAGFAGAFVSLQGLQGLARLTDEYKNLNARLKNATTSQQEFAAAQRESYELAQRTATPLGEIVAAYARVDAAVRSFGGSQKLAFETTERLVQAGKVFATSNEASKEVIAQLTSAFADGVVKGTEFSQVMKNAPGLLQTLAQGLGISAGELRKLAAEGKLTAEILTRALGGAADTLAKKAAEIPNTFGDAFVVIRNSFTKALGEMDAKLGASAPALEALGVIAKNMKTILDGAIGALILFSAVLARNLVLALAAATTALFANAIAARAAASAAAEMGIVIKATVPWVQRLAAALNVLLAGLIGWEIGTWLRDNFKMARDAGYWFVEGMLVAWERLKQGFMSIQPILVMAWNSTMDKLKEIAASFYDGVAAIFDKLPGEFAKAMAESMRGAAAEIRSSIGEGASDRADAELARITKEAQDNVAAINEAFDDLRANPMEASSAAANTNRNGGGGGGDGGLSSKDQAKLLKAELERAQTELDQALRRRQITEQQYYEGRSDLIQIAFDKDVVAQREAMDKLNRDLTEGLEARADLVAQRLARREERIARDRQQGRIGLGEARQRTDIERGKARAEIDELIKVAEPLKDILGPDTLDRLHSIRDEIGELKTPLQELGEELKANLQDPLADAFSSILKGTKSAKAAFQDFGRAVIDIIIGIFARRLAANIVGALPFSSGGAVKKATGGFISGPGGPTDDRVPAMLSNGEYVLSAAAVRRLGINFLDHLNSPSSMMKPAIGARLAYAAGGVVSSRGPGERRHQAGDINVTSYVDARGATNPAEIARAVEAGRRQTLNDIRDLTARDNLLGR